MLSQLTHFKFWCQKVLPLVYDDSLSYYETLCKIVEYLNNVIGTSNELINDVDELKKELQILEREIKKLSVDGVIKSVLEWLETNIAKMIFVVIDESGYIKYYIPKSWKTIKFRTTGLDIDIDHYDYGHLVLLY